MPDNKLQIRAKLLSAIAELQICSKENRNVPAKIINELKSIDDKKSVVEILVKEIIKDTSENKLIILTFLLQELVEKELIETVIVNELVNPKISDSIKTKLVNVLRSIGRHVNYEEYTTFFENPDEIIDADTSVLLNKAIANPAAQIDFLDFLNALPEAEQDMLLSSLNEDYDGDNIANILTPVILSKPYSPLALTAIKYIGESKSKLAVPTLHWVLDNVDDEEFRAHAQKGLNMLKLAGFSKDETESFYREILSGYPVYKCYSSLPDGHGNIGLIFSRRTPENLLHMFSVVLNDIDGIVECFGFNDITDAEFQRIVKKFYDYDTVVEVTPEFCRYLTENAEKLTRLKYSDISYEYIAWKTLLKDISSTSLNLSDGLKESELSVEALDILYNAGYFKNWFFEKNDSDDFCDFIENLQNIGHENFYNEMISLIKQDFDRIYNPVELKRINHRLLITAYLLNNSGRENIAGMVYSLSDPSDYKYIFLDNMLKKSIYEYFLNEKERYYDLKKSQSIFTRKQNNNIDIKFVEFAISEVEKHWVEHE